jgi:hypothetical protein
MKNINIEETMKKVSNCEKKYLPNYSFGAIIINGLFSKGEK